MEIDVPTLTFVVTALGVLVAAVNHIFASREANRQREVLLFDQVYSNILNREFRRDYEIVMYSSKFTWENHVDWKDKYTIDANADFYVPFMNVWSVLSYTCDVVNRGFINFDLFDDIIQYPIINFWEKYRSLISELRTQYKNPIMSQDIEQVYNRIIQKREKQLGTVST